jgi:hypothetical protein
MSTTRNGNPHQGEIGEMGGNPIREDVVRGKMSGAYECNLVKSPQVNVGVGEAIKSSWGKIDEHHLLPEGGMFQEGL